jgi:hypothetical protein
VLERMNILFIVSVTFEATQVLRDYISNGCEPSYFCQGKWRECSVKMLRHFFATTSVMGARAAFICVTRRGARVRVVVFVVAVYFHFQQGTIVLPKSRALNGSHFSRGRLTALTFAFVRLGDCLCQHLGPWGPMYVPEGGP